MQAGRPAQPGLHRAHARIGEQSLLSAVGENNADKANKANQINILR